MAPVVELSLTRACVCYLVEGRQRSLSDGRIGSCVSPGQFPSLTSTAKASPRARVHRLFGSFFFGLVACFWLRNGGFW